MGRGSFELPTATVIFKPDQMRSVPFADSRPFFDSSLGVSPVLYWVKLSQLR